MSTTDLDRALQKQVEKREAEKERRFREAQRKADEEVHMKFGSSDMTKEELKKIIDSDRRMYYRTEELNDKLYIHYKGWKEICCLEGWTGLRALYAECNAFSKIQGLENCRSLRSLFLSDNCIRKIEGLDNCPDLWSLNLSNNFIERIEGLSKLQKLNTLIIAKNKIGLGGVDDIAELADSTVCSLDIQDNKIWDPDVVPEVLARMADLRVVYLKGNPCCKKVPNYRKSLTVYCTTLKYLDDRPVFPEDRRSAEAFNRGGLEEEKAEKRRIREEETDRHDRNMKAFGEMVERAKSEKRERTAMRSEDKYTDETDPVEDEDARMRRQRAAWEKEHEDELRDDLREHAERCLKSERERAGKAAPAEDTVPTAAGEPPGAAREAAAEVPAAAAAEVEPAAEDTEEAPAEGPNEEEEPAAASGEAGSEKKVDKRKLIYEDIWDDVPHAATAAPPRALPREAPRPTFAPPARRPQPPVPEEVVAREAGSAPSWYSRFAEIAGKVPSDNGGPASGGAAAAGAGPASAAEASARESGRAAAAAELDEMD